MVILPKISWPKLAKHVRPISMGSSVSKLLSRVLLERSLPLSGESGTRQCAGRGRQTADYLFSVIRPFSLEKEWRMGPQRFKLDISKAFERLDRRHLFRVLESKLGATEIARCWRGLLDTTVSHLQTPWQNSSSSVQTGSCSVSYLICTRGGNLCAGSFSAQQMESV